MELQAAQHAIDAGRCTHAGAGGVDHHQAAAVLRRIGSGPEQDEPAVQAIDHAQQDTVGGRPQLVVPLLDVDEGAAAVEAAGKVLLARQWQDVAGALGKQLGKVHGFRMWQSGLPPLSFSASCLGTGVEAIDHGPRDVLFPRMHGRHHHLDDGAVVKISCGRILTLAVVLPWVGNGRTHVALEDGVWVIADLGPLP